MNAHPTASNDFEEFLAHRATSDVRDGFVAPKEDVTSRVAQEIQRRSGCVYSPIMADYSSGQAQTVAPVRMSADPAAFVQLTLREVVRISTALSTAGAEKFDLRFDNPQTSDNLRSEHILVAVRYVTSEA